MYDLETQLLKEFKEFIATKSTFGEKTKILPTTPQSFVTFPTIIFRERNNSDYTRGKALNYVEYIDNLIYQVDIYTKDVVVDGKKYVARDVVTEIKTLVAEFFRNIGFERNNSLKNDYIDKTILRQTMTFTGQMNSWNKKIL